MNIFEELKKLGLPEGEYVVIGSGILGALGIREIHDIDLIVTPALFDKLKNDGWVYDEVEIEGRMRKRLKRGVTEAFKDFWYLGQDQDTERMIGEAVFMQGYPFSSLQELLKFKRSLNRPKDQADILLIEKYLAVK